MTINKKRDTIADTNRNTYELGKGEEMSHIFLIAFVFSIWSVILFLGKTLGLSMILFVIPFLYYVFYVLEKNNKVKNVKAKIFIIPIALLSSTYFIFNNQFYNKINLFVIPFLFSIMVIELLGETTQIGSIFESLIDVIFEPIQYIKDTILKIINAIRKILRLHQKPNYCKNLKKIFKGICLTLPVVLIIIILLSTADETFGKIFANVWLFCINMMRNIRISNIIVKVIVTICVFLYLSSFFDYILTRYQHKPEGKKAEISNVEEENLTVKMILGALNVIYFLFCFIQIRALVVKEANMNYSQYARQGFFQLMIVSVINLITILIAKQGENNNQKSKYITSMCFIMIIFTFMLLIFSAIRMHFYESAYGYTLLRLLVYCILITEALLLVPTIIYVKDKKIKLIKYYGAIMITMYVIVNFMNMDQMIAKRNIDRYIQTGKIDMVYLKKETGTDAVNQIMRLLEINMETDTETKQEANQYLKQVYTTLKEEEMDFRSFNLSKLLAKQLIEKGIEE